MDLLVEKYRPNSLEEMVLDDGIRAKVLSYIKSDEIPHLLFYGKSGVGKTSLCRLIVQVIDCDYLYLNASDENDIETVRTKIKNFVINVGFHKWKIVVLDEADTLTQSSMAMLRLLMEDYSANSRFILTCNYIDRIIEPITSRCQLVHIEPTNKNATQHRIENILKIEKIKYSPDDILKVIEQNYPDMRRMLNHIQYQTNNQKFIYHRTKNLMSIEDKLLRVLSSKASKKDKLEDVRNLLSDDEGQDFQKLYAFLFDNIDVYGKNKVGQIIVLLDEGQYRFSHSSNRKLNLIRTIVEIINII